jgi:hypothetical protein
MEKILLSFVSTFGSATSQDTIGAVSIILIGLPLLIILYRILKWILIVNEKMSVLREVVQSYKQIQEEKEKEIKKTSQTSDIDDGARDSRFVESTIVTSTEINSIEKNSCHYSIVANTGTHSIAECEGNRSIAACTGAYSMAIAQKTSVNSITSNTGFKSVSENKGDFSISANIGEYSATTSYGQYSTAINIGECSIAVNTGDYSVAIATSERSFAKVEGKESIAIVCGARGRANGKVGCWLILTERGEFNGRSYPLKDIKAIKVDGKKIKETKWYRLIDGEIIEDGDIEDKIEP